MKLIKYLQQLFIELTCKHTIYNWQHYDYLYKLVTKNYRIYNVYEKRYCPVCHKYMTTIKIKSNLTIPQIQLLFGINQFTKQQFKNK